MTRIFIQTYGCAANKSDSEAMISLLQKEGHELSSEEDADYIIVNTCGVKARTENKIIHRLSQLSESRKKVIVSGCLTKINRERIEKAIPGYAAIMDTNSIGKINEIINRAEKEGGIVRFSKEPGAFSVPSFSFNPVIRTISISQGCLSSCTFCGTKLSRGSLSSYRPDAIRDAVKKSVKEGYKEIHLTSQDISAYGRDIGTSIVELLDSLCKINRDFLIRVGMMNPLHFRSLEINELAEAFRNEKIFKFLHLPVQSGSDDMLKRMKRGHTSEDYLDIAKRFRRAFPELQLWTDIIAAYPGESEEDFELSLKVIRKSEPDFVNISRFGARPGTEAAKLAKVPTETAKQRSRKMAEICRETAKKRNKKWTGWYGKVIIDEYNKEKKSWIGRNYAYKPVVMKISQNQLKLGDVVSAEVTGITESGGSLVGKPWSGGQNNAQGLRCHSCSNNISGQL